MDPQPAGKRQAREEALRYINAELGVNAVEDAIYGALISLRKRFPMMQK
jgi:hypothetical protein